MKWLEKTIGEITEIITKGTTPTTYGYGFTEQGVNFVRAESLSKDGRVNEETFLKISNECHIKLKRSQLKADDILFSIAGYLGKTGIVKERYLPANTNQAVGILRPIKEYVFPKFLQYQFINPNFYELVNRFSAQSAQPNINLTQLKGLKVFIPPLNVQGEIVSVLSAYDELIEINLKRINLLEQAAQNIYKEWFVHMRFPGHEDTTIDQVTGIPDDWRFGYVSEFGSVITGKTPSKKKVEYYGGDIPFIKTPDMHNAPYVIESKEKLTQQGVDSQSNKTLPKNTVMVSCIGTAGVVAITSTLSQTNQQINSVVLDTDFKTFYFYCFAKGLKDLLNGLGSNGATMVNVNKGKFENIQLLIPSDNSLKRFNTIVKPIFSQILTLLEMNKKLIMSRDILLPRLMNQTIKV
jgi:type I restriction enzyme S subunit